MDWRNAAFADHLPGQRLIQHDIVSQLSIATDDRDTVVVYASVVASVLAALYYIGRIGFDNPASSVIETLGLSLFLCASPRLSARLLARADNDVEATWWRSQPFLTLAAIVLVALAGVLAVRLGLNLILLLSLAGIASALIVCVRWLRRGTVMGNVIRLVYAAGFGIWVAGVVWSSRHKSPLFWEALVYNGNVHHDPLYLVSMGNMMQTYGVPSTGLDGIPYTPYHYGSAWLFAQLAEMVHTDLLSFFNLGFPVIAIPLLFGSVLLVAVEWKHRVRAVAGGAALRLRSDWLAWVVFLAATIGVIPSIGLDAVGVWIRHVVISESYVMGLACFLLALATAGIFWQQRQNARAPGDTIFLFVFLPLAIVALGFLKISTMVLFVGVVIVVTLLTGQWRTRPMTVSILLLLALSAVTYRFVSVPGQNQGIVPFAYVRSSVLGGWWPFFLLLHFLWSWLYIAGRLREERVRNLGELSDGIRSCRLLDVAVVAFIALAGLLPGELIDIHGGSAFYFSDLQRWTAVPLVMASASQWICVPPTRARKSGEASLLQRIRVEHLWAVILLLPLVAAFAINAIQFPASAASVNLSLRRALYRQAGFTPAYSPFLLADARVLDAGLRRSSSYQLLTTLKSLRELPSATRRESVLFIPKSLTRFWQIFPEPERCTFVPFVGPAVSGMALLDGMPPFKCLISNQYSLPVYQAPRGPQSALDTAPSALCVKAKAKGFARVVVLEQGGNNSVSVHTIACDARGRSAS